MSTNANAHITEAGAPDVPWGLVSTGTSGLARLVRDTIEERNAQDANVSTQNIDPDLESPDDTPSTPSLAQIIRDNLKETDVQNADSSLQNIDPNLQSLGNVPDADASIHSHPDLQSLGNVPNADVSPDPTDSAEFWAQRMKPLKEWCDNHDAQLAKPENDDSSAAPPDYAENPSAQTQTHHNAEPNESAQPSESYAHRQEQGLHNQMTINGAQAHGSYGSLRLTGSIGHNNRIVESNSHGVQVHSNVANIYMNPAPGQPNLNQADVNYHNRTSGFQQPAHPDAFRAFTPQSIPGFPPPTDNYNSSFFPPQPHTPFDAPPPRKRKKHSYAHGLPQQQHEPDYKRQKMDAGYTTTYVPPFAPREAHYWAAQLQCALHELHLVFIPSSVGYPEARPAVASNFPPSAPCYHWYANLDLAHRAHDLWAKAVYNRGPGLFELHPDIEDQITTTMENFERGYKWVVVNSGVHAAEYVDYTTKTLDFSKPEPQTAVVDALREEYEALEKEILANPGLDITDLLNAELENAVVEDAGLENAVLEDTGVEAAGLEAMALELVALGGQ